MVTERTLKKWRKEALNVVNAPKSEAISGAYAILKSQHYEQCQRVLRMTQILLDQHLVKGK